MQDGSSRVVIRSRIVAAGLPGGDPACAGCPQLGTFRGLRLARLAAQGGLGCDAAAPSSFVPQPGRWAAVAAGARILAHGAGSVLADAARAGAALVVVTEAVLARADRVEAALAREARVVRVDPADVRQCAEELARAVASPGAIALAVAPCTRGAARRAPIQVAPSRCNRCGACLSLACPALADEGGDAVAVDPGVCTGCGLCVPLCRALALRMP